MAQTPNVKGTAVCPHALFNPMLKIIAAVVIAFSGEAMAVSGEPLKALEVGSYAEMAARPNPLRLAIQPIPSLAALLLSAEQKAGSPLTKAQVVN